MEKTIKPIKDFDGYFISNYGEIYSKWVGKGYKAKIGDTLRRLNPIHSDSRWAVGLHKKGKKVNKRIHIIVLETFIGNRPNGMEACHFPDRNTSNNRLDNLRWDTKQSNQNDRVYHKTTNRGERNGSAKLKEAEVREIRNKLNKGITYHQLAIEYKVAISTIQQINNKKIWKYLEN